MIDIQRLPSRRCAAAAALLAILGSACGSDGPPSEVDGELVDAQAQALAVGQSKVTPEQAQSVLYQRYQEYLNRQSVARVATGGASDTLAAYAAKCDIATGIHVPAFNCDLGTEVPNQEFLPGTTTCNKPNVLNNQCDKGSKFQVLVQTPNAAAVAHCRKVGLPATGSTYNDIA